MSSVDTQRNRRIAATVTPASWKMVKAAAREARMSQAQLVREGALQRASEILAGEAENDVQ